MATIITKNSSTASAAPAAGDLTKGELAVNVTDKKLYTKDNSATVVKIVGSLGNQEASAVAITGGTVAGVAQTGGTINNTPIGGTTAAAVTGTVVTATTNFVGAITGAVTGNVTGNVTGAVTGNVTGNLTGNVTASTGSSSFNNVTINGSLDMNSGTAATITGLATPTNSTDAATKGYVDTSVAAVVASAPGALDTLNELAAALGNDASFSTTVTNSIAAKLPLAGGTMSGAIAMGTNKITGLGTPTAGTDAATKTYVDSSAAGGLPTTGGTMTGNIVMGANKVTSTATPSTADDLTRKGYVDSILGSATAASTSASNAATSETNAANSATASSGSATSALGYLNAFKGQYYGSASSNPTLDPLGAAIGAGDLYYNTTVPEMRVYNGSAWVATYLPSAGYATLSGTQTFTGTNTFTGSSSATAIVLNDAAEVATVSATAATGTIAYDITTQSVLYYTSNASANWTVNFRASSGTSLNTLMSTGQSMTVAFLVTQGSTAYYNSAVQVDGTTSGVTTRWLGGAPTAGNASGIDSYRFLLLKTGSATFTILASVTQFKA
jgi:hypothetical protein